MEWECLRLRSGPKVGGVTAELLFVLFLFVSLLFVSFLFEPAKVREISTKPKEQKTCLVLLTASAPTRGKGTLAVIWIFAVVVFEGSSVLIHQKVRDRGLSESPEEMNFVHRSM